MQFWKQNTISVKIHQKSCSASHFEFVVSYAITITILAYLLHLAKLCNTNEILSEEDDSAPFVGNLRIIEVSRDFLQ